MVDIINLISQNGIAVVCVAYLIYFQASTMKKMIDALNGINKRLEIIENILGLKGKEKEENEIK